MRFSVGDRVYHCYAEDCTGQVRDILDKGYGDANKLYLILWDDPQSTLDCDYYAPGYLRLIPFASPPPKIKTEQEPLMSQAIWCDQGGHAFSSKDPGKRHFSETRTVDDGYRVSQVTADMDICGECSEKSFLASTPALTASKQDAVPTQGL